MNDRMDKIEVQRELPTPVLLRLAYDRLSESIFQGVLAAGFTDLGVRPMATPWNRSHWRMAYASRIWRKGAGMTAQAMGELVDDLEAKGYVERRGDPADRRAKRIYLTPKGQANAAAGHSATQAVEATLTQLLGSERYEQVRESLLRMLSREWHDC